MVKKIGFIQYTLHPGRLVTIWGKMGDGKSNFASFTIEKLSSKFYHTYTNILFFSEDELEEARTEGFLEKHKEYLKVPENVHIVTKISELLIGLNKTSKYRKNVVILDEASLFASGVMAREKKVTWLKQLITSILRKLNSSIIIISQDKDSVVPMLREKLPSIELRVIRNRRNEQRRVEVYDFPDTGGAEIAEPMLIDTFFNIPISNLPYDSYAPAKFEFDLNFDDFLNKAGEYNSLQLRKKLNSLIETLCQEWKEESIKGEKKIYAGDLVKRALVTNPDIDLDELRKILKVFGYKSKRNYLVNIRAELNLHSD